MSIGLNSYASGDTGYIAKMNDDNAKIEAAVAAINQALSGSANSPLSIGYMILAAFGSSVAVIGKDSYKCTDGGGAILNVAAGYAWVPSSGIVVRLASATTLDFTSQSANTYYVHVDSSGNPSYSTTSTDALYSVVWSGSSIGTITRIAAIMFGATDWSAAQVSAALAASYESLDARLEAGEAKAVLGELARTAQKGRLSKTVAGSNITLTDTEGNNAVLDFSGTLTADINVTVPTTGPRIWAAVNRATGNFTITLKTSGGAGVKLPAGGTTLVYHDGTDVLALRAQPNKPAILAPASAAAVTADFARADLVRVTLDQATTLTLSGAADGQKCMLELTQDGTGGWSATFGSEVGYSTDLPSITIDTMASKRTRLGFIYHATAAKYELVAVLKGF